MLFDEIALLQRFKCILLNWFHRLRKLNDAFHYALKRYGYCVLNFSELLWLTEVKAFIFILVKGTRKKSQKYCGKNVRGDA